jgi:uncharacterized membrane protein
LVMLPELLLVIVALFDESGPVLLILAVLAAAIPMPIPIVARPIALNLSIVVFMTTLSLIFNLALDNSW